MSRVPPHDLNAEESLIGAVLIRPTLLNQLASYVDPSDFYKPDHQTAWAAMLHLHQHGDPVDLVTVASAAAPSIEPSMLHACFNATPAVSAAPRYAELVVGASRSRKLMAHLAALTERCYMQDADDVLADLEPDPSLLVRDWTKPIDGLSRLDVFLNTTRSRPDSGEWLIPGTLKARWRQMFVAEEGVGKGTLLRFIGLHVAAGRNPWDPREFIDARTVLNVDCENPDTTIALQASLANKHWDVEAEAASRFFIWHREGGMNLRDRRTQAEFERVLQQVRPDNHEPWVVVAGPLYKMFRRQRGEDQEQATLDFLAVLDDLRVRYNFALLLEHHAPGGQTGHRDIRAFGSSALSRWPEHGIALEVQGNPLPDDDRLELKFGRFRRDREPVDFPTSIVRGNPGQPYAWIGTWRNGRGRFAQQPLDPAFAET